LLKYREEIIQAKVAKEHIEGTLKSENMFLKSQVHAEQQEKNNLEETLNQEIISLQEKLGKYSDLPYSSTPSPPHPPPLHTCKWK
jgi:hypothetical protein